MEYITADEADFAFKIQGRVDLPSRGALCVRTHLT
jgi:hypothetical protein